MGLDAFPEEFRKMIQRVFDDRMYILGKARTPSPVFEMEMISVGHDAFDLETTTYPRKSKEPHVENPWPSDPAKQKLAIKERILELFYPPPLFLLEPRVVKRRFGGDKSVPAPRSQVPAAPPAPGKDDPAAVVLKRDTGTLTYHIPFSVMAPGAKVEYQTGKKEDSEYLTVTLARSGLPEPVGVSSLFLSYEHKNIPLSKAFVSLLLGLASGGKIYKLRIAGPEVHPDARGSMQVYLTERDEKLAMIIAGDIMKSGFPMKPAVMPGTKRIGDGIGWAVNAFPMPVEWKRKYGWTGEFPNEMAIYLARALESVGGESLEAFVDRLEKMLKQDDIDSRRLHLLDKSHRDTVAESLAFREQMLQQKPFNWVDEFRGLTKDLIAHIWDERDYILCKNDESVFLGIRSKRIWRPDERKREIRSRLHELMEPPPGIHSGNPSNLERMLAEAKPPGVALSSSGPEMSDAYYTIVKVVTRGRKVGRDVANLYITFDHGNCQTTKRAVSLLWPYVMDLNPQINWFRVAGPDVSVSARASLQLYLSSRGIREKSRIVDAFRNDSFPLLSETYFGTQKLIDGIGYARQPKTLIPGREKWIAEYGEWREYSELLATYMTDALLATPTPGKMMAGESIVPQRKWSQQFSETLAALLKKDGINPQHVQLLSKKTAVEIEDTGWGRYEAVL